MLLAGDLSDLLWPEIRLGRQPRFAPSLNNAHPLVKDIDWAYAPLQSLTGDFIDGKHAFTPDASVALATGVKGNGAKMTGAAYAGNGIAISNSISLGGLTGYSAAFVYSDLSYASNNGFSAFCCDSGPISCFGVNPAGKPFIKASSSPQFTGAGTLPSSGIVGFNYSNSSGNPMGVYINGQPDANNTTTPSTFAISSWARAGCINGQGNNPHTLSLAVSWKRSLTDAEHALFAANPWAIFAKPASGLFFVPAFFIPPYLLTSANQGYVDLDFGTGKGSSEASVLIAIPSILSTTQIDAFIGADDSTTDHSADDHKYFPALAKVCCGTPSAGVGFTLYARSKHKLTGKFRVRFVWV